ncbi:MAG: hypothetical protein ACYTEU_12185 [Planctomycetota bacterium]|jgi:hypothetical protein
MCLRILKLLPIIILFLFIASVRGDTIPVPNHSFEFPVIDPNENVLRAVSFTSLWTEDDIDREPYPEPYSRGTGTFVNTPPDSNDHIANPDGDQLAFIYSFQGNSIWQYLPQTYQVGKYYRLTVAACLSESAFAPKPTSPLILTFHYLGADSGSAPLDIATYAISPAGLTVTSMEDFSVDLPTVVSGDAWAGRHIGIAIRGSGFAGGYWDFDNVRLMEFPRTPNFNNDSIVNLVDFAKMAAEWLQETGTTTDVTGNNIVNEEDLLILAERWLDNV